MVLPHSVGGGCPFGFYQAQIQLFRLPGLLLIQDYIPWQLIWRDLSSLLLTLTLTPV